MIAAPRYPPAGTFGSGSPAGPPVPTWRSTGGATAGSPGGSWACRRCYSTTSDGAAAHRRPRRSSICSMGSGSPSSARVGVRTSHPRGGPTCRPAHRQRSRSAPAHPAAAQEAHPHRRERLWPLLLEANPGLRRLPAANRPSAADHRAHPDVPMTALSRPRPTAVHPNRGRQARPPAPRLGASPDRDDLADRPDRIARRTRARAGATPSTARGGGPRPLPQRVRPTRERMRRCRFHPARGSRGRTTGAATARS